MKIVFVFLFIFNLIFNSALLNAKSSKELYEKIDLFSEVLEKIKEEYVEEVDLAKSMDEAIKQLWHFSEAGLFDNCEIIYVCLPTNHSIKGLKINLNKARCVTWMELT